MATSANDPALQATSGSPKVKPLTVRERTRLRRELVSARLRDITKLVNSHHLFDLLRADKGSLSPARRRILAMLLDPASEPMTTTLLAKKLGLKRASVREQISFLEDHRMVKKLTARDRRQKLLKVTREGKRVFGATELLHDRVQKEIVEVLGAQRTLLLLDILGDLQRGLEKTRQRIREADSGAAEGS